MATKLIRVNGINHPGHIVRFRGMDSANGGRSTVTVSLEMEYAEAETMFSNPGEWSVVHCYDPVVLVDGNIAQKEDAVTDCSEYDVLLSIKDTRDGMLEVVMGKMTDSEALAELKEALEG